MPDLGTFEDAHECAHECVHEYVSFDDPDEHRTWVFDLTFLTSSWTCIYGKGCQGVHTERSPELEHGCCTYGAHFVDDDDHDAIAAKIDQLGPDQWQFRAKGRRNGPTRRARDGQWVTRIHQGACIMLNRPDFERGAGCALHVAALDAGERPIDWKPDVCWQLPLRLDESTDDHGHVTSTLREWKRRDWGAGGAEFAWWCTEGPEAFVGGMPAYVALREEIVEMVGERPYELFADYVDRRFGATRGTVQPVPHPAIRARPR